jgi:hypothetical protein
LNRAASKLDRQAVFLLQPLLQHVELQRADDADDGRRAVLRLEELDDAFLGHLLQASFSFLAFIASPRRTRRRISGAKFGTPWKTSASPSVSVSPMRSVPWLGMPTTSPA